MLHGFPEWKETYGGLLVELLAAGYCGVACDQRGYSPGASPAEKSKYTYDELRKDAFAVARKSGFQRFHLVGHDHGGLLGWYMLAAPEGEKILSYTSLSIPHIDAFSSGLYGDSASVKQQLTSQYFTTFVLPDAATLHNNFWYNTLGKPANMTSPTDFQKAMWWYNGVFDQGILAMPPLMSATMLEPISKRLAGLRTLFGGIPNNGTAATNPIGNVQIPSLFVCGSKDTAILCNEPYAKRTADFCKAGYEYMEADCGHGLLSCEDSLERQRVIDTIITHIKAYS